MLASLYPYRKWTLAQTTQPQRSWLHCGRAARRPVHLPRSATRRGPLFVLQVPQEVTVTIVTPPEGFTYRYMDDWMHNHHASRGTLTQLCTWREQHIERAEGFGNVVAFGTIFMMGITSRTPKSFVPYSHRWGEVPRLSIRPNEATWRTGSSFLAVLDADNPSS